jgi:hypothetical protein
MGERIEFCLDPGGDVMLLPNSALDCGRLLMGTD